MQTAIRYTESETKRDCEDIYAAMTRKTVQAQHELIDETCL